MRKMTLLAVGSVMWLMAGCGATTPKAPDVVKEAPTMTAEEAAKKGAPTEATLATVGKPAPAFTLKDLDGKDVSLADYKGKTVVLEWFNPGCPFVVYAHGEGPLKDLAAKSEGVSWLAINSGAPGKQGHGVDTNKQAAKDWSLSHPILVDEDGKVGRMYGAKTTPQMYIIDEAGTLVYMGALDNAPLGEAPETGLTNHVSAALGELTAKKPISVAQTKPYGCSVKY